MSNKNPPFLISNRLELRPFEELDHHLLVELDQDPEVMRYISDGRPTSAESALAAILRFLAYYERSGGRFGFWKAYERETQMYIGWFHLRPGRFIPEDFANPELGYRLRKAAWAKGYASEISKELLRLAFENYGVLSVFAITMKENLASQSVMKKIGMKLRKEYIERQFPGSNQDAVEYYIDRASWIQSV